MEKLLPLWAQYPPTPTTPWPEARLSSAILIPPTHRRHTRQQTHTDFRTLCYNSALNKTKGIWDRGGASRYALVRLRRDNLRGGSMSSTQRCRCFTATVGSSGLLGRVPSLEHQEEIWQISASPRRAAVFMNDSTIKHGELQLGIIAVIYREFFLLLLSLSGLVYV